MSHSPSSRSQLMLRFSKPDDNFNTVVSKPGPPVEPCSTSTGRRTLWKLVMSYPLSVTHGGALQARGGTRINLPLGALEAIVVRDAVEVQVKLAQHHLAAVTAVGRVCLLRRSLNGDTLAWSHAHVKMLAICATGTADHEAATSGEALPTGRPRHAVRIKRSATGDRAAAEGRCADVDEAGQPLVVATIGAHAGKYAQETRDESAAAVLLRERIRDALSGIRSTGIERISHARHLAVDHVLLIFRKLVYDRVSRGHLDPHSLIGSSPERTGLVLGSTKNAAKHARNAAAGVSDVLAVFEPE